MLHKRLWISAAIIALFVLFGFALSVPHTKELPVPSPEISSAASTPVVTVSDSYRKGMHTLSGYVLAPDACSTVTAAATVTDASSSPAISLALSMPPTVGTCLIVPTKTSFSTALAAPSGLPILVTVNGVTASTSQP